METLAPNDQNAVKRYSLNDKNKGFKLVQTKMHLTELYKGWELGQQRQEEKAKSSFAI